MKILGKSPAIPPLFPRYSPAIPPLFPRYPPAIPPLFPRYSPAIPLRFPRDSHKNCTLLSRYSQTIPQYYLETVYPVI